ncbi:MAG: transglutaminase domain-containing protein [Sulfuricurvum sp.]|uniref:transglutaminase domain-containing protein n=1 Tax=Sulfuricurvum sp. TaxID=2025608 RepID=UPI002737738E|nr:transglutaminase domain-containing protein [Sulfuricurvum sp.]MDP2850378.1 transglutaminase domain-containing protein [Sulfuricurvum sp.]
MDLWIKIVLLLLIAALVYREILKSAAQHHERPVQKVKASFMSLVMVGTLVGAFTYLGMSMTWIETRDLRPIIPKNSPQMVSLFDRGVIELEGMVIKTNLAEKGELSTLANELSKGCNNDQGCEVQKMFDYVTNIPYKTDYTSRNAKKVVESNWGDCDDKSNLFASLLNEKGYEYRFVYVPHHVFVVVHLSDTDDLPFLSAKLNIEGKNFYYAETTSEGAKIGEFNGQFPHSFEGIYDMKRNKPEELKNAKFSIV